MYAENSGRRMWLSRMEQVKELRTMKRGSDLHQKILDRGTNPLLVDLFLRHHLKKMPGLSCSTGNSILKFLYHNGGSISGGSALNKYLGEEHVGDYDFFFGDFVTFSCMTIETIYHKDIDVCLFDSKPYEAFDLTATMLSFDGKDFDVSSECEETFRTGTCRVRSDWIIHPTSTVGRIAKYGERYGLKFLVPDFVPMALMAGVDESLIDSAIQYVRS